jgi:hypothetical protein
MKARIAASLAMLVSAPLFAGCVVYTQPAPVSSQPPMEPVPADNSGPAQLPPGIADGRPPRLHAGAGMNYWVWATSRTSWHLRSTTARREARFQGRVRVLNGASIARIATTRTEYNDRVRAVGNDVDFDFVTLGNEDGFDLELTGSGCLEFNLRIDGGPHPGMIVLGQAEQGPGAAHFIACPR